MAKNYTFAEAVKIINEGTDMESITDIGRRYPVLLNKVTKVAAKAGEDFVDLMGFMPDYLTANKVNSAMKTGVATGGTSDDAENENEDDTDAQSELEVAEAPKWNESMSSKQLWEILGKAGKRKLAKSTKKSDLVKACKQAFGATDTTDEAAEDEEAEEATTEANPYDGKSAMELFKECKKRGIKAAPKKTAKYYADMLMKNDAEQVKAANDESDSDDWDEDEDKEKEETKKPEKKDAKKSTKKEETANDDDDWDI